MDMNIFLYQKRKAISIIFYTTILILLLKKSKEMFSVDNSPNSCKVLVQKIFQNYDIDNDDYLNQKQAKNYLKQRLKINSLILSQARQQRILKNFFKACDPKIEGKISKGQLYRCLRWMNCLNDYQIKEVVMINKNSKYEIKKKQTDSSQYYTRKIFNNIIEEIDAKGQFLQYQKIRQFAKYMVPGQRGRIRQPSAQQMEKIIKQVDKNGDGKVSIEQMYKYTKDILSE